MTRRRKLRGRYGRTARRPGVTVTKVYPFGSKARGIGTRVVLEDGFTWTFIGPVSKKQAVEQAEWHRARGERSER